MNYESLNSATCRHLWFFRFNVLATERSLIIWQPSFRVCVLCETDSCMGISS